MASGSRAASSRFWSGLGIACARYGIRIYAAASAGTYSILQPTISAQLRRNKQAALTAAGPEVVCTANIGCQLQLGVDSRLPVRHWIELLV